MNHTKGTWKVSGDYVIAMQNIEDYVEICRNLASNADARLIAAAPNLLEACKLLLKTLLEAGYDPEISRVKEIADVAIAKAKKE